MRYIILAAVTANQVNLIFHQRNKRANDYSNAFADDSRQLVAQAFSTAGGHNHKGVVSCKEVLDHSFLRSLKL